MRSLRVFIIDDHPLVREWLGNLLRLQPGMEVCGEASDAPRALEAMRTAPPDIAVVDLRLERGSGLQLIKDICDEFQDTRVVVLSMHEDTGDVERALRAGALGYVMKRESTGKIVDAIRHAGDGRVYADPAILSKLAERLLGRPKAGGAPPAELLSDREIDIFRRLGEGRSTRSIAEDLGLSLKTVQTYCARMKEKLGAADAAGLTRAAIRWVDGKGE